MLSKQESIMQGNIIIMSRYPLKIIVKSIRNITEEPLTIDSPHSYSLSPYDKKFLVSIISMQIDQITFRCIS